MRNLIARIRQSLSLNLSLGIVLMVAIIFILALGFLFNHSRRIIKEEATQHATRALNTTAQRSRSILDVAEVATDNTAWVATFNLNTDSLLELTRLVVLFSPDITSCFITTESGTFKDEGDFSAYSIRDGDTILTGREAPYDYYSTAWYKTPRMQGKACWVAPFDDENTATASASENIVSYSRPITRTDGRMLGVISTDVSLDTLNKIIESEPPYPNAYSILLGKDGHYLVHPDPEKVIHQSIFSDIDPKKQSDIILLGHEMLAGKSGQIRASIEGKPCLVFYQPLEGTPWSLALICPESDILHSYNRLGYIIIPLIVVGLLIILLICRKIVLFFIQPLHLLAKQTKHITEGHFDEQMPESNQHDVVGDLQSSFAAMQQAVSQHMKNKLEMNEQTEQRNKELEQANQLARDSIKKKAEFLQNMTHQVRTPLNIITGFAQVLHENRGMLSDEEVKQMTGTMYQNSKTITHIINTLTATSLLTDQATVSATDRVFCNELAREAFEMAGQQNEHGVKYYFKTTIDNDVRITTNADYLSRMLNELLRNALRFTQEGSVSLLLKDHGQTVAFTIEDTGPGIPKEEQESVFDLFTKHDEFTEGVGLGLTIAKRLAVLMGGDLTLDTKYDKGCRITLELPKNKKI